MPFRESRVAGRLMTYSMLLAASYTLTRTVGDALFLSRVGNEGLAPIFAASGLTTAIITTIWYFLTHRMPLLVTTRLTSILFFLLTLAAWAALPLFEQSWALLASIYLLAEVKGSVNTINIVSTMNGILGRNSSRGAWAKVGLGAPLAGILVGCLLGLEANVVSLRTWLLLSAVLDAMSLFPISRDVKVLRSKLKELPAAQAAQRIQVDAKLSQFKKYACSTQFRFWIGVLISAKVVVLTLVSYFWKTSVNDYFVGSETALASYFGYFYALVGLLTLLTQLFVTGSLLSRRSLAVPILVMPVSLSILGLLSLAGSSALFLVAIFTLAKSMEVWRRSVHDTTLNLLYTRIQRNKRRGAIAFNSAAVKPLSEVGASMALWMGGQLFQQLVMMTSVTIWFVSTLALLRLVSKTRRSSSRRSVVNQSTTPNQTVRSEPV